MNEIKSMVKYGAEKGVRRNSGRGKTPHPVMVSIAVQNRKDGKSERARLRISVSADIMRKTGYRYTHLLDMEVNGDGTARIFESEYGRTLGPSGGNKCIGPDTRGVVQFSLYDGMGFSKRAVSGIRAEVAKLSHKQLVVLLPREVFESEGGLFDGAEAL